MLQRWGAFAAAGRYLAGQQQRSAPRSATFKGIGSCPVESFNFGSDQGASGGGAGPGRAYMRHLVLTKRIDKLSPGLWQAMTTGRLIEEVELVVAGSSNERVIIRLRDVLIAYISAAGGSSEHELEQVRLDFAGFEQTTERPN